MRKIYYSIIMTGAALLFLSSCVKTPLQPEEPRIEPDTAKSTFSGLLVSPSLYGVVTFRNYDTLSDGKVFRRVNGIWTIRQGDVLAQGISCSKDKDSSNLILYIGYFYNLNTTEHTNTYSGITDSLRSWNLLNIGFRITAPKNLTGFSFDNRSDTAKRISSLSWYESLGYEQFPITSTPTYAPTSAYAEIFSLRFAKIPLSFETPAKLELFTLVIDKFTSTPPKRISGRISFKMISGDNPRQIVEVRDGRFDNVRFEYN